MSLQSRCTLPNGLLGGVVLGALGLAVTTFLFRVAGDDRPATTGRAERSGLSVDHEFTRRQKSADVPPSGVPGARGPFRSAGAAVDSALLKRVREFVENPRAMPESTYAELVVTARNFTIWDPAIVRLLIDGLEAGVGQARREDIALLLGQLPHPAASAAVLREVRIRPSTELFLALGQYRGSDDTVASGDHALVCYSRSAGRPWYRPGRIIEVEIREFLCGLLTERDLWIAPICSALRVSSYHYPEVGWSALVAFRERKREHRRDFEELANLSGLMISSIGPRSRVPDRRMQGWVFSALVDELGLRRSTYLEYAILFTDMRELTEEQVEEFATALDLTRDDYLQRRAQALRNYHAPEPTSAEINEYLPDFIINLRRRVGEAK